MSDDEKPKRKLPAALVETMFKPGQSGNPTGRPPGVQSGRSKRISKFAQIWGRADAPEDWFGDSLRLAYRSGITVDELIALRIKYCLATNTKYYNTSLLVEQWSRAEGKIPLRILYRPGEDDADDFDVLSDAELQAYIDDVDRRAQLAAKKEDALLPEATPVEKPDA